MSHEKGTKPITRNVLNMKEQFALGKIMQEQYTASGLDDTAFAIEVSTNPETGKLFREIISASHIRTMRVALDIPGNRAPRKPDNTGECLGLIARVQALEEQVKKLAVTVMNMKWNLNQ